MLLKFKVLLLSLGLVLLSTGLVFGMQFFPSNKPVYKYGLWFSSGTIVSLTKDADADVDITFTLSLPAGATVRINWGDGNTSSVIGPQTDHAYQHSYASAAVDYTITFSGDIDQLTKLDGNSEPLSGDISGFNVLTSLTSLNLNNTSVSGDISGFNALTLFIYLNLSNTSVSGDISGFSALTSLANLILYNTPVSGNISSFSALTSLVNLSLNGTLVSYTTTTLPDWSSCNIYLSWLSWSQTEVDAFFNDMAAASGASAGKKLYLGGNNAAPSAGVIAGAIATLSGLGWDVDYTAP